MLNTDAVVNILRRCAIGKIKLNDSLEYEKIVDIKSLFNVELYTLNDLEVKLIKSKVLYLERLKNINNKGIFIYKNQIIG
ncbi:Uncharacterised protein [Chlamydia trachomatis]|nr:Uncharacterised protein [Chlamydia trachomatis]